MTTRILCGIDGQAHSARAAAAAFELTNRLSGELTLFMANPALLARGGRVYLWSNEYVQRVLDEAFRKAKWSGVINVKCESRCTVSIADSIVACADQHEVDFIVIGARDRPGVLRVLSGSVSKQVTAKANCPVLIVRRVREQRQNRPGGGLPEVNVFRDTVPAAA
jgi:nucleotide-binding universal stress UspA family protein